MTEPQSPDPADKASAPAGWYPDPDMVNTQRYWDGHAWTDSVAPASKPTTPTAGSGKMKVIPLNGETSTNQLLAGLLVGASVVGLILSQQSVSVMSGSGIVWTGAAICIGVSIVCQVVKSVPIWAMIVCGIITVIAVLSALYVENQLDERRDEISNIFE